MSSGKQTKSSSIDDKQTNINKQTTKESEDSKVINVINLAGQKAVALSKSIIGDYGYLPRNKYPFAQKKKILNYLKMNELENAQKLKFTQYDQGFIVNNSELDKKSHLLKAKTNLEAAQQSLQLLKRSKSQAKARFLSETAYQFDQQRYSSIAWGLLFGALICSTVYRGGSTARKTALFLTSGHLLGQVSYHYNIDRYFDAVYRIYESEALAFVLQQRLKQKAKVIGGKTTFTD